MDSQDTTIFHFKNGKHLKVARSLEGMQSTLQNNVLRGMLTLKDDLGFIFLIKLNEVVYVEEG